MRRRGARTASELPDPGRSIGVDCRTDGYRHSVAAEVASRDLARFMLEGLARASLTYDSDVRAGHLLAVIKRATHMLNRKGSEQDLWPEG